MSVLGFLTFRLFFILHLPSSVYGVFFWLSLYFAWAPAFGSLVPKSFRSLKIGFVSILFICRALPLSFMGCVGLLCFVVPFLTYIYIYVVSMLACCVCVCWFALFSVVVRCLVPCCLDLFCFV